MFDSELSGRLHDCGVVAVLMLERAEDAVPLARALYDGGVGAMELTLRTPAAVDALKAIVADVPEMLAGVGTILTPDQVATVHEAGAAFGVAPGCSPCVVAAAREVGLPFAPGVATPTEVEQAIRLGCRTLKLFPAERLGGLPYLKSMAAPFTHLGVRFVPLGGVNASNMADYLGDPLILAVGGSWVAPKDRIAAKDWAGIGETAARVSALVREIRRGG